MPSSPRSDGKYNHKSEYYLVSVKQRLEVEFRNSLKRDKKRHAEPKAQRVIPFGIHRDGRADGSLELAELLYLVKCSTEEFENIFRNELIKKIEEKIEDKKIENEVKMITAKMILTQLKQKNGLIH